MVGIDCPVHEDMGLGCSATLMVLLRVVLVCLEHGFGIIGVVGDLVFELVLRHPTRGGEPWDA